MNYSHDQENDMYDDDIRDPGVDFGALMNSLIFSFFTSVLFLGGLFEISPYIGITAPYIPFYQAAALFLSFAFFALVALIAYRYEIDYRYSSEKESEQEHNVGG